MDWDLKGSLWVSKNSKEALRVIYGALASPVAWYSAVAYMDWKNDPTLVTIGWALLTGIAAAVTFTGWVRAYEGRDGIIEKITTVLGGTHLLLILFSVLALIGALADT